MADSELLHWPFADNSMLLLEVPTLSNTKEGVFVVSCKVDRPPLDAVQHM
jgi:hypothetical protein